MERVFLRGFGMRAAVVLVGLLTLVTLTACGGGGGDDGGGGNSGGFTLSATSATFSAREAGPVPASQSIGITLTGNGAAGLGAAFRAGQVPNWLNVNITGSAPNYNLVLTVSNT